LAAASTPQGAPHRFTALRRLGQRVWRLNYNGADHGLAKYAHKRDDAQRMAQFFDHDLLEAPPARWMTAGIPALEKGRELRRELDAPSEPSR